MPRAKRKPEPQSELEDFISLDQYVEGEGVTYANVIGDGGASHGILDGDLLVLHKRPVQAGETYLVNMEGEIRTAPDEPEFRRQRFYIVGREPVEYVTESLGVIAYLVRPLTNLTRDGR